MNTIVSPCKLCYPSAIPSLDTKIQLFDAVWDYITVNSIINEKATTSCYSNTFNYSKVVYSNCIMSITLFYVWLPKGKMCKGVPCSGWRSRKEDDFYPWMIKVTTASPLLGVVFQESSLSWKHVLNVDIKFSRWIISINKENNVLPKSRLITLLMPW